MHYKEFEKYSICIDKNNFANKYQFNDCYFYIEPSFYSQLLYYKGLFPSKFSIILNEIEKNVLKNKKVIFTGDYSNPIIREDNFVYQEIEDIINKLNIPNIYKNSLEIYGD